MIKQQRIALVIKTDGLEYDDRVRKEIMTTQKLYPNISFKIFVMLPKNVESEGVTSYGTPYRSIYVPSRDKYPSAKKAALKSYEFYQAIKNELKSYDAIWCANEDMTIAAALAPKKHLLWDLHELPGDLLDNPVKRTILKYIMSRCKVVVHANPQRKKYLEDLGVVRNPSKHFALRNFPNFEDKDSEFDEVYYRFLEWKGDSKCVYLQGLTNDSRAAYESVSAVMQLDDLKAVVVGNFDKISKERLVKEYGTMLEERVYFVGKIPQLKIPQYVEKCFISLVFYKNVRPNNYFCEANRFYQSVIVGLPVVVGNNPSMKELVEKYGLGVSIDDDGSDVTKIKNGIGEVLNNYDFYCKNNENNRDKLLWKEQEDVIRKIIEHLLEE